MTFRVYGYGQASFDPAVPCTDLQESFLRDACLRLVSAGRLPSDAAWDGFFRDDAMPKPVKLCDRPVASMLLGSLMPGRSAVMAMSSDRIFAGVTDACDVIEFFVRCNIRLIVLDFGIDTGAPLEMPLPLVATMKSLRLRERRRTKEAFALRKGQGLPAGGKCPIGWVIVRAQVGGLDRAYFVPDEGTRRVAEFIVEHFDRWGGTFEQTAYWLNAQKVFRPDGRRWRRTAVFNWYHAAKDGFPLPNGRRQAFPIPVDALPSRRCRTIAADDK